MVEVYRGIGTTNGVWKKGQSGPLPATSGIRPPLRIGVLGPPISG